MPMNMKKYNFTWLVGLSAFAATAEGRAERRWCTPTPPPPVTATLGLHSNHASLRSSRLSKDWSRSGHQTNGKTEELLTGDKLTKATDAAKSRPARRYC